MCKDLHSLGGCTRVSPLQRSGCCSFKAGVSFAQSRRIVGWCEGLASGPDRTASIVLIPSPSWLLPFAWGASDIFEESESFNPFYPCSFHSGAHVKVSGHLKVRWEFLAAQAQSITAFHPWRLNSESPRGVAVAFPGRRCKVVRSSGQVRCCSAGSAGNAMGCNILCPSFSEQFDAPGANFCTEPMGYQPPKTVMSPDEPRPVAAKVLKFGKKRALKFGKFL